MYYVDYLAMIASYLKPSLNSMHSPTKFSSHHKILSLKKKNQNFIKPLIASIFLLICIVATPQKPSNVVSICEKYNSPLACQVW